MLPIFIFISSTFILKTFIIIIPIALIFVAIVIILIFHEFKHSSYALLVNLCNDLNEYY